MAASFSFTSDTTGQITGITLVGDMHDFKLRVPAGTTFTKAGTTVVETISGNRGTTTLTYTQDTKDSSIYHLSSETDVFPTPTTPSTDTTHNHYFSFTLANGAVTAASEVDVHGNHTRTTDLMQTPTAKFVATAAGVTETLVAGNAVDTLQYVQIGSSGQYALASLTQTFIDQGSAATALSVEGHERDQFTIDATGKVTAVKAVAWDGTAKILTPDSHASYTQLAAGFVLETHTMGNHSSFELFYDGNGDGNYTAIAHGSGATVDLVGVQAQLTTAGISSLL